MHLEFGVSVNVMRLYTGRRSLYLAFRFGRRTWWISRWDTARVSSPRFIERGGVMCWYWGAR